MSKPHETPESRQNKLPSNGMDKHKIYTVFIRYVSCGFTMLKHTTTILIFGHWWWCQKFTSVHYFSYFFFFLNQLYWDDLSMAYDEMQIILQPMRHFKFADVHWYKLIVHIHWILNISLMFSVCVYIFNDSSWFIVMTTNKSLWTHEEPFFVY